MAESMTAVASRAGSEAAVAALCRVLREGADVHRCLAARALGALGGQMAVDALIAALMDADEDVRVDAATALAAIGDARAGAPLLDSLIGDPVTDVKLAAVDGLCRLHHDAATPWLSRLVAGRDEDIVWDDEEFFDAGWDGWTDLQVAAIGALSALSATAAVPDIVAALADEEGQDLDEVAFDALAGLGADGARALAGYLDDHNPRRRRRAAAALVAVDPATAVEHAVADADPEVRLALVRRAAAIDPSTPSLAILFDDPSPEVRADAVRLLGRSQHFPVRSLLDDPSPEVQGETLALLAEDPGLMPAMEIAAVARARLREAPAKRAAAAAIALAAADPDGAFDDLAELLGDGGCSIEIRLGALRALVTIADERSVAVLTAALGDQQRRLRLEAMAALASIADADPVWPNPAGAALLAALAGELVTAPEPAEMPEPEPETRPDLTLVEDDGEAPFPTSTMESILGGAPGPRDVDSTPRADARLTEEDIEYLRLVHRGPGKRRMPLAPRIPAHEDVPRFAARVLGDVARHDVARALARAVDGRDDETRLAATESLARLGPRLAGLTEDVVAALIPAASGAERDLRLAAVRALGASRDQGAVATLERGLDDEDGFVRAESVRALSALGAAAAGRLMDDADQSVRLAAAEAVAKAGAPDSLDRLIDFAYVDEGHHRREAARLLRDLDVEAANARFIEALEDSDRLRLAPIAIEALEELNRPLAATAAVPATA